MKSLVVVLLIIFLIAVVPLKARVQYSEGVLSLSCYVWKLKISILPKKDKPEKEKKEKPKKEKKKPKEKEKPEEEKEKKKPKDIVALVKALIPPVLDTLSRLRRKLLINIHLNLVLGTSDPCDSATNYGKITAIMGAVTPLLENVFRIGEREITTGINFESEETEINADVSISLRIWHIVYIVCGLLPAVKVFLVKPKKTTKNQERKVDNNGQASCE